MKFLTEADMRAQYRISAFSEYHPEPGTRLTPGARQFLNDRGVKIGGEENGRRRNGRGAEAGTHAVSEAAACSAPGVVSGPAVDLAPGIGAGPAPHSAGHSPAEYSSAAYSQLALRSVRAMFLQAGADLMSENVLTAKELFELERALAVVEVAGENARDNAGSAVKCAACEGIGPENAGELLEDCFEITGFHAQAERGKEIVRLHGLRCALRQLEPELPEGQRETTHRVINRLSQMICGAFGGKICQRNG